MGIPAQHVSGKAHHIQDALQLLSHRCLCGDMMVEHGLRENFINMLSGIQRGIRVLKHHLKLRPDFLHLLWLQSGQIPSVIPDDSFRRPFQPDDLPADGGFAAARLSHQSQRFPFPDGKAHAVHRMNMSCGMGDDTALYGIIFFQILHFQQSASSLRRLLSRKHIDVAFVLLQFVILHLRI